MATFSASTAASTDDGQEAAGTVSLGGSNINANTAAQYIGLRFLNVTIPKGATISAASLDLYFVSTAFDDPDVTIYAEATDDAATFTTTTNDMSGRTSTAATVNWNASSLGTGVKTSPSIVSIIQEIVNRAGWVSGNDIVILLKGNGSSSAIRVRAYDDGGGSYPTLNITYTASSPVTVTLSTLSRTLSAITLAVAPGAVVIGANTLSRALSAVSLTVTPGGVVISASTISRTLSAVPLGVAPGGVTLTFDTLSLLAEALDIAVGQSVALSVLNGAATVPSLNVVPGAAGVLLASLGHILSADSLTVVPGPVVIDAATLAAVLEAVTLGISSIGGDVTILLQTIAAGLLPVEIGVIPGDMVIPLQTFEPTLNIERLLVFMMLGCVMLGDRANYGAAVGDFRRYLVAVDDRGGCDE